MSAPRDQLEEDFRFHLSRTIFNLRASNENNGWNKDNPEVKEAIAFLKSYESDSLRLAAPRTLKLLRELREAAVSNQVTSNLIERVDAVLFPDPSRGEERVIS